MMEVICPWLVKLPYLNLVHIMLPFLVRHPVLGKAFLFLRFFVVQNVCNLICLYFQEHFWWTLLQGFGRWHKKSDSKSSGFAFLKKKSVFSCIFCCCREILNDVAKVYFKIQKTLMQGLLLRVPALL